MKFDLSKMINHHHTGADCKCTEQIASQFAEVMAHKVRLTKKCDFIQQKLLEDLEIDEDF